MLVRCGVWGVVIALSGALVAGCGSAPEHGAAWKAPAAGPGDSPLDKIADAHAHYAQGVILEADDDLDGALEEYEKAALDDLGNEALVLEVSGRLLHNRQQDKALELLTRAADRRDVTGRVLAQLGIAYSELGKTDLAISADRRAIAKAPDSFAGYENMVVNYLQTKRPEEAVKVLDEAAGQAGADATFLLNVAKLYSDIALQIAVQRNVLNKKALAVLNRVDKLHPADPAVRLGLADDFNQLGDPMKAAQLYLQLLKDLPDALPIRDGLHAKLTEIYLRGKDSKRAIGQLEAIVKDDPTNPQAYYFLGSLLLDDNKLADAADDLSKAVLLNPDLEQAYYELARAQLALGKTSDALGVLEKARQKFSQNFVLEYFTAMVLGRQKAYGQALPHFTAAEVIAQASEPKLLNEEFYFQFGAACERSGDYAQAAKLFEKSLQIAPNFAEALNYLGYMWAEHGENLDRAREMIERAVKAEPKNAAYLDSLGWVLYKLNQPREALPFALQAAQFSEEPDATVYDHIGDIYAALHDLDSARQAWRKSLSLEANDQVRKKIDGDGGK